MLDTRTSAAMVLAYLYQNIAVSAPEGLVESNGPQIYENVTEARTIFHRLIKTSNLLLYSCIHNTQKFVKFPEISVRTPPLAI